MDPKAAGRAIAKASETPTFSDFEKDTFGLGAAVQLRVSLGDRQHCLNAARKIHSAMQALIYRLENGKPGDRQSALDFKDVLRCLNYDLSGR